MNYSYTFNLKSPNDDKPSLIYLRASIKGEKKYLKYSTGEKIHPKYWSSENQFPIKIKGRSTEAIQINSVINQLSRYAESFQLICSRLEAENITLKADLIKEELDYQFKKIESSPHSFFSVFQLFIDEKTKLGKITSGTLQRYKNIKEILENFSNDKKYNLTFKSINDDFYVEFVNYSRKTLKHKDNTLGRNIGFIKTYMNWAGGRKYHNNYDFKRFEKTSSETDEIALSFEELETLWNFDFSENKRLEKVRDVFVLGCASGMRYSDYSRINKSNIRNGQIFINTQKQKSNLGIPLNKYSRQILEKYDYNLPIISPQKFRKYIKEVCKKVEFDEIIVKTSFRGNERIEEKIPKYKMISTHTARRTFITLSLEKGMRPDIIMSITGHKSYSSFKKYIKLSKRIREEEMTKAWD
ncbi:site-specific integrase [Aequorivita flava]|uniref:Tyrosine-type recombinase/integrase n=1 Tax=Aequorivita flava TaxID=3114371 RepID=A0AB35YUD5_9FLAO